jgi:hypothetical protein
MHFKKGLQVEGYFPVVTDQHVASDSSKLSEPRFPYHSNGIMILTPQTWWEHERRLGFYNDLFIFLSFQ